jgi:hypothetical protein
MVDPRWFERSRVWKRYKIEIQETYGSSKASSSVTKGQISDLVINYKLGLRTGIVQVSEGELGQHSRYRVKAIIQDENGKDPENGSKERREGEEEGMEDQEDL